MVLLMFHLVFSTITYDGIDIPFASQILAYNAVRFPRGIFFLFGQGRLALFKGDPMSAIKFYMTGMEVIGGEETLRGLEGVGFPSPEQLLANKHRETDGSSSDGEGDESDFKSLQGLALWELAVARTALWDIRGSVGCWRRLREEAGWSKAVYTYGLAVALYELGEEENPPDSNPVKAGLVAGEVPDAADEQLLLQEKTVNDAEAKKSGPEDVATIMETVPGLMQRIAGKSIPFEVSDFLPPMALSSHSHSTP